MDCAKPTVPLKPFAEATLMVYTAPVPCDTLRVVGVAVRENVPLMVVIRWIAVGWQMLPLHMVRLIS